MTDTEREDMKKTEDNPRQETMPEGFPLRIVAHIHNDFSGKFGVPRQSGLVPALQGEIVFEPPYRNPDALRGIEGFSHLWLLWVFSESILVDWSPTVRPPRLGGNTRMGVFATRAPYRPNPIGLSSVKLERVKWESPHGAVLCVSGADLMNGTPILDIKPYLPYTDSHPDAHGGFAEPLKDYSLAVDIPPAWQAVFPAERLEGLRGALAHDPRPSYQDDPNRVYHMDFAGYGISFTVANRLLTVCEIKRL